MKKHDPRLIETAFPLKQVSLDSVHEKNVRYGRLSALHTWPARRPLAASRAALPATLLPDPGSRDGRRKLLGRWVTRIDRGRAMGKHDSRRERRRWVTAVTGAAPRPGRRRRALTRGRRGE